MTGFHTEPIKAGAMLHSNTLPHCIEIRNSLVSAFYTAGVEEEGEGADAEGREGAQAGGMEMGKGKGKGKGLIFQFRQPCWLFMGF